MFSHNRSYQSHLTGVSISAMHEAHRTIIGLHERFEDPNQAASFIIPLVDMLEYGDYGAARIALDSIYSVCGLKVSAEFDEYIKSGYSKQLLVYYSYYLLDLYVGTASDMDNPFEHPAESPTEPPTRGKVIKFPGCRQIETPDDELICLLCRALQILYDESYFRK